MKNKTFLQSLVAVLLVFTTLSPLATSAASQASPDSPKLVLVMVIDQFRADYLTRFKKLFKPALSKSGEVGGFEYLTTQGAYYPYGEYDLLQCMTGPGHATILSGSYPYQMGIPINNWFSRESQKHVYCAEDLDAPLVGVDASKAKYGRSPKNFWGTTVGDELKNAGHPSKVVAIALKDRSAIMLGGHRADLAMWLDQSSMQWISSKFYWSDGKTPSWVQKLNESITKRKQATYQWNKGSQDSGLSFAESFADTENANIFGGTQFPHQVKAGSRGAIGIPLGNDLTLEAAEHALKAFDLGKHRSPDILAVSFSSHDIAGHAFGPNSRELEEMTLADDRAISRLLNSVRKSVPGGLKNVVFVLTGDHGVAPVPEYLQRFKVPAARVSLEATSNQINDRLNSKYGKPKQGEWILYADDYNYFLNASAIAEKGLERSLVEAEGKAALKNVPGFAYVFTSSEYETRKLPPGMFGRQASKTFVPGRSGDIIGILKPFHILSEDTASHLTGYSYDRTVPIIIGGAPMKPGKYAQKAEVIDIAPTLSFILGVLPPATSEGRVLSEAIK